MPDPAQHPGHPGNPAEPGHSALFISYRSADGKKDASRLAEDLRELFGPEQVFFDKHDLQAGLSWREQIDRELDRRPVVLLVISEQYFGARDAQGRPRIEQADDPVRMELLDAIRVRARLLPLLCEGVTMPREADLPTELRVVPQAHALKLRTEDWSADLLKLADRLVDLGISPLDPDWHERYTAPAAARGRRRLRQPLVLGAIALALAGGGGAVWLQIDARQRHEEQVQAQRQLAFQHLSAGLMAHRGKDVNLDLARIQYLAAIEALPDYGPAHYFLAQVYATQSLRDDALGHFRAALAHPAGLDKPQLADAGQRLAALERSEAEPAALGGIAMASPPTPAEAPRPGGEPVPAPPTAAPPAAATPTAPATATAPSPAPARPGLGTGASGLGAGTGAAIRPGSGPGTTAASPATSERGNAVELVTRVPARPERQRETQAQAEALFAADAAARMGAATTLGVELAMASDVLPLALQRALAATARSPLSDSDRAGLIATLRLVGSASPLSLQANRVSIQALLRETATLDTMFKMQAGWVTATTRLQASAGRRPLAYMQIASEAQRSYAAHLADRLRRAGYDVPGIENVGNKAPARTDLRAQGFSNLALARWMARAMSEADAGEVNVQVLRRAQPSVDTYELWLGRDLCVAPGPQPAACSAG